MIFTPILPEFLTLKCEKNIFVILFESENYVGTSAVFIGTQCTSNHDDWINSFEYKSESIPPKGLFLGGGGEGRCEPIEPGRCTL